MEIWKDIVGYEGLYQVSSLGNIKSFKNNKERILKPSITGSGYKFVILSLNSIKKNKMIHQLVAIEFLNHTPCGFKLVIDHIDNNRLNNNVNNLRITTNRDNCSQNHLKSKSKYVGVCFNKPVKKWMAYIYVDNKVKNLGYFENEEEASIYYKNALKSINENLEIIIKRRVFSSKYKGITYSKIKQKWIAKYKCKYIGAYLLEIDAHNAYQKYINSI